MASKRNRKTRQQESAARREAIRREYERKERRRRMIWVGSIVVVLALIILSVAYALTKQAQDQQRAAKGPNGGIGLVDGIGIPEGSKSAKVTVTAYEDYQCPFCKQFETNNRTLLEKYMQQGKIRVVYSPVSFLNDYSSRALNAAACVYDEKGAKAFLKMHDLLFENQPSESGPFPTNSDLATLAAQAGASKSTVSSCIDKGTYNTWGRKTTETWSKHGFNQTPTILVNGKSLSARSASAAQVKQVLDSALKAS
jgi:protein-disulfide isomerase